MATRKATETKAEGHVHIHHHHHHHGKEPSKGADRRGGVKAARDEKRKKDGEFDSDKRPRRTMRRK